MERMTKLKKITVVPWEEDKSQVNMHLRYSLQCGYLHVYKYILRGTTFFFFQ